MLFRPFTHPGGSSQESKPFVQLDLEHRSLSDVMNPAFVSYVVKHASRRATSLVRCGLFSFDDWEDLRQDLLLDFFRRISKFSVSRGDLYAFAHSVILNQARSLATRKANRHRQQAMIFECAHSKCRLHPSDPPGQDDPIEDPYRALNQEIDILRAIDRLPAPLRNLANDLKSMTVAEVSVRRRKSRSRIYQMIEEIRVHLPGRVPRSSTEGLRVQQPRHPL
jgi:RNA polymerase sigma factor (sigma-70 family)